MTSENHEVQDIRLCINNIKRAEYRKNWKKKSSQKRSSSVQESENSDLKQGMFMLVVKIGI